MADLGLDDLDGDETTIVGFDSSASPIYQSIAPTSSSAAPVGYVYNDDGSLTAVASVVSSANASQAAAQRAAGAGFLASDEEGRANDSGSGTAGLEAAIGKVQSLDAQQSALQSQLNSNNAGIIAAQDSALSKIANDTTSWFSNLTEGLGNLTKNLPALPAGLNWNAVIIGLGAVVVIGIVLDRKL